MLRSPQAKHICFYSKRCEWSSAFLRELNETTFKTEFAFVCVDPAPYRPQLPKWLKKVPTLVIQGEAEPRTDAEVMNWLSQRRLRENPLPSQAARPPPATSAPSQVHKSAPMEPEPFNGMEMGIKGTDPYCFLDTDTTATGNGGYGMQHSFEFLSGAPGVGTATMNDIGGGGGGGGQAPGKQKSKKEELFDKQMEAYQRDRESGMPQIRPRQ